MTVMCNNEYDNASDDKVNVTVQHSSSFTLNYILRRSSYVLLVEVTS